MMAVPPQHASVDYTGLAATAWDLFSTDEVGPDDAFFRAIVAQFGEPALDIGCGSGRLLLPMLGAGVDIEGVEPSADMRALCRAGAATRGLQPVLHQQLLQTLDLPRRYRTIFVACGTLHLVIDRAEVVDSLRRLHDHLLPGGAVVLTAFAPWVYIRAEAPFGVDWHPRATTSLPDGTDLVKEGILLGVNKTEQTAEYAVRYRRLRGETVLDEQICQTPTRWYFKHELSMMLEQAGLQVTGVTGNYTDEPVSDAHDVMVWVAIRRSDG
ncbi:MAG: class I SAM-dependent methyltransferase [Chloroflexi bacterium]|nr:class I SAM-dependent methyltransferase [Chloroflexota bacterium]